MLDILNCFDLSLVTWLKKEKMLSPAFSPFPTMFLKGSFLRTINAFPNQKILDTSKLKVFTDDNFQFDENGRKVLYRWVENTVGKGEIAHFEQFLLFSQCF